MTILAFDIGGSAVKFGVWDNEQLENQSSFETPNDWETMKSKMMDIFHEFEDKKIEGVSLSAPGVVDNSRGIIGGISAVPYIHDFMIKQEFENLFHVPVVLENDANCAALAEVWKGATSDAQNSIFLVIGTGIGGSIIINRELYLGRNLFAGEFGYMFSNDSSTVSEVGSIVKLVKQYNDLTNSTISGEELFLRIKNDVLAKHLVDSFTMNIARCIYNLLVSFDPGRVVIGGAISKNDFFIEKLQEDVLKLTLEKDVKGMNYEIVPCKFGNDANLIGAVFNYIDKLK